MSAPAAVIFDFDGVIADSELPANHALAESLCAIGLPTTVEDCLRDYCGHNWQETQRRIEARFGRPLPGDFREAQRARGRARLVDGLAAVPGCAEFLQGLAGKPRAIASSSSREWLSWALERLGFSHHFGSHLYSADGMARGKPHPDIYLAAAHGIGLAPADCLAIEDSPVGASAAVAAGMTVVGLAAAGHIADPAAHAERLRAVGVHRVAFSYAQVLG